MLGGGTTRTLTWNAENRLAAVTDSGQTTQFRYDPAGIRTTVINPDGSKLLQPFPHYEEERSSSGTLLKQRTSYTLGGQLIALEQDGVIRFANTDHLGSPAILMSTSGGNITSTIARYKPYGGYLTEPTATALDRGYTGHDRTAADDDLDLIYMNARYLDSSTGRFISADTLVPDPANPQAFNRYSYALGNPVMLVDPSGHFSEEAIWKYLWDICGGSRECAHGNYNAWRADSEFWWMLRAASAGDIIFASTGTGDELHGLWFRFEGAGQHELNGISLSWQFENYSALLATVFSDTSLMDVYGGVKRDVNGTYSLTWGGMFYMMNNTVGAVLLRPSTTYRATFDGSALSLAQRINSHPAGSIILGAVGGAACAVGSGVSWGATCGAAASSLLAALNVIPNLQPGDKLIISAGHLFRFNDEVIDNPNGAYSYSAANRRHYEYFGTRGKRIARWTDIYFHYSPTR